MAMRGAVTVDHAPGLAPERQIFFAHQRPWPPRTLDSKIRSRDKNEEFLQLYTKVAYIFLPTFLAGRIKKPFLKKTDDERPPNGAAGDERPLQSATDDERPPHGAAGDERPLQSAAGDERPPHGAAGDRVQLFTAEAAEAGGLAGAQSNADGSTGAHG